MKRVPLSSGGAARRAYHGAYSKGVTQAASKLLGGNKLKTPKFDAPQQKTPKADAPKPDKREFNVSFGNTGFVEDL